MRQLITKPFPYYVGIYSLEELMTKDTRVCVINILGTESRKKDLGFSQAYKHRYRWSRGWCPEPPR